MDTLRMKGLESLTKRIREIEAGGRNWRLLSSEIRDLLGVNSEEFYRRIYGAEQDGHPLLSLSAASGTYGQDNIWEFVALVELFCGTETERVLENAGVFFSHPEQMEILGVFLGETAAALAGHELDAVQFRAMLRTFGHLDRARDVYVGEYFPIPDLIDRAAAVYCGRRRFLIPELARKNVKGLLEFFFRKHVLQSQGLFAVLAERLRRLAVEEGYAEDQPEYEQPLSRDTSLSAARGVMELADGPLSRMRLKGQYKRLMKIYHPDINPRGLRRCQEITAAYSLLLSSL